MSKETGTAKELNLKPGDVAELVATGDPDPGTMIVESVSVLPERGPFPGQVELCLSGYGYGIFDDELFRIVSRASEPQKVKIVDEVRVTTDTYTDSFPRGSVGMVVDVGRGFIGAAFNGAYGNDGYPLRLEDGEYELVINDTPKLWRDMTDEEKGALLLARHEGKVIEALIDDTWMKVGRSPIWSDGWSNGLAYRVKPDRDSIKMEGL